MPRSRLSFRVGSRDHVDGVGTAIRHSAVLGLYHQCSGGDPPGDFGITNISRFQMLSQPLWLTMQIVPLFYVFSHPIHNSTVGWLTPV